MLKFIETYNNIQNICNIQPYNNLKLLSVKKSKFLTKIFRSINLTVPTIFSIVCLFFIINTLAGLETITIKNIGNSFIGLIFNFCLFFAFNYAINYTVFSLLFNKKLKKIYYKEIEEVLSQHKFKDFINISEIHRNFGNFKNPDDYSTSVYSYSTKERLNLLHVDMDSILNDLLRKKNNKDIVKNINEIIEFIHSHKDFKNNKDIFKIFYNRYEKMLKKEIINIDTFKQHILLIMRAIFTDLTLFSEKRTELDNYVQSYNEINNAFNNETINTYQNKQKVTF
tara:strand:- start:1753 stop:2598 length:846 start_codon:yes stop_codon:yes gene_type:complete